MILMHVVQSYLDFDIFCQKVIGLFFSVILLHSVRQNAGELYKECLNLHFSCALLVFL